MSSNENTSSQRMSRRKALPPSSGGFQSTSTLLGSRSWAWICTGASRGRGWAPWAAHYYYPLATPARAGALSFPHPAPPSLHLPGHKPPPTDSRSSGTPGLAPPWLAKSPLERVQSAAFLHDLFPLLPPCRPRWRPASLWLVLAEVTQRAVCDRRAGLAQVPWHRTDAVGEGAVAPRRRRREASRVNGAGAGPGRQAPVAGAQVVDAGPGGGASVAERGVEVPGRWRTRNRCHSPSCRCVTASSSGWVWSVLAGEATRGAGWAREPPAATSTCLAAFPSVRDRVLRVLHPATAPHRAQVARTCWPARSPACSPCGPTQLKRDGQPAFAMGALFLYLSASPSLLNTFSFVKNKKNWHFCLPLLHVQDSLVQTWRTDSVLRFFHYSNEQNGFLPVEIA